MSLLRHQLGMTGRSLARSPGLTLVLVGGIALGITIAITFTSIYYLLARDPIPHKSDRLFYVQLDNWGTDRAFDDEDPERPPDQLNWVDTLALMESDVPTHQSGMYKTELVVFPAEGSRPVHERARLCYRGFFGMFEPPFRYGGPWQESADVGPEPVVVLSSDLNRRLFGGGDSVGRTVRIQDREFRVVGVLDPWRPIPKYFDPHNDPKEAPDDLYLPFRFGTILGAATAGNRYGWLIPEDRSFEGSLHSELLWIQMWVQLDSEEQRTRYQDFIDAYTAEQRRLGRYPKPEHNNRVLDVREWLELEGVVPDDTRNLPLLGWLFLGVCSLNLIAVLLGKFLAQAPEVGVRRVLGAHPRTIFLQYLMESAAVGVAGGAAGLLLSVLGLRTAGRMLGDPEIFHLESTMVLLGVFLAIGSGLLAGVYPAWRVSRVAPSSYLSVQ